MQSLPGLPGVTHPEGSAPLLRSEDRPPPKGRATRRRSQAAAIDVAGTEVPDVCQPEGDTDPTTRGAWGCAPLLPAARDPSEEEPHAPWPAATRTHFLLMPESTWFHHGAGPAVMGLPLPKHRRTEPRSDPTRTVVRASSTLPCRIGWSPSPTR